MKITISVYIFLENTFQKHSNGVKINHKPNEMTKIYLRHISEIKARDT